MVPAGPVARSGPAVSRQRFCGALSTRTLPPSLGVSLFRTHRLPLTTAPLAGRWSLVAFQPPPGLAGGLVLVPTQGPFM